MNSLTIAKVDAAYCAAQSVRDSVHEGIKNATKRQPKKNPDPVSARANPRNDRAGLREIRDEIIAIA